MKNLLLIHREQTTQYALLKIGGNYSFLNKEDEIEPDRLGLSLTSIKENCILF